MGSRVHQVQRISKLLEDGLNTALQGAPRSGKSWITDAVCTKLSAAGVKVVRLDLSLTRTGLDALQQLALQLGCRNSPSESLHGEWRRLRSELESRNRRTCLALDEFDAVVKYNDSLEFLTLLRELIHRPDRTNCSTLIVSRRTLETIESEVRGISTLAAVCVPECAGSIGIEDLRAGWPETLDLGTDELESCLAWSAGHPPLILYWLSTRPDLARNDHGEHFQVAEFGRLLEHLARARLDDAAAQLILGPVVDDWFLESRQLEMLGVVGRDGELSPLGTNSVFRECLRQRSFGLSPWGILGAVEIALRGLIEERLSAEWGDEWANVLQARHKGAARMITEAEPKQAADERRFGRSGPWLAYTYPGDLAEIILRWWDYFGEIFIGGDKQFWKARLDAIATYRTPVAHNRVEVLGTNERVQCRMYAEQVLRSITAYRGVRETADPQFHHRETGR